MNATLAGCGCPVPAVGAPGSVARRAVESRPCDKPRCRSGLPPKFTDAECESYCRLDGLSRPHGRFGFLVDMLDKSVMVATGDGRCLRFPSLTAAGAAYPWGRGKVTRNPMGGGR